VTPSHAPARSADNKLVSVRASKSLLAAGSLLICSAVAADVALSAASSGDYVIHGLVDGDNAGPAINALVHGNLAGFAAHQPVMGPVSLLLRAPFAALAGSLGGGNLLTYRLGALACLLPVAAFAAWLIYSCVSGERRDWSSPVAGIAAAIAVFVLLEGPATRAAIRLGHPEEPLTAMLATAAVVAAIRGRSGWAGLLIGVAIATKAWALIAVPPVLAGLPAQRRRAVTIAAAVAAVLIAPGAIANPSALLASGSRLAGRNLVNPFSLWWPLGRPFSVLGAPSSLVRQLPYGFTRLGLAGLLLAGGLATAAFTRIKERGWVQLRDPLALLALLGLVRCIGDPLPQEYYYAAALIPLAVWEVVSMRRFPLVTALAAAYVAAIPGAMAHLGPEAASAVSLISGLALASYLAYRVFHDPRTDLVPWTRRLRAGRPGEPQPNTAQLIPRSR
jgi:hypothetical protein